MRSLQLALGFSPAPRYPHGLDQQRRRGGLVLCASSAFAADAGNAANSPNLYIEGGLSLMRSNSLGGNVDSALANQGLGSSTASASSNTNVNARLGYQLSPNLAVEASYDRLGGVGLNSTITTPASDTASGTWKSQGLGLHVLGIEPITPQWSVYGRVGVEDWRTRLSLASNAGGTTSIAATANNFALALGAGTSYALTNNLDLVGDWTHFSKVGNTTTTGAMPVNLFSAGLRYHFQ